MDVVHLYDRRPHLATATTIALTIVACAAAGWVFMQVFHYLAVVLVPLLLAILLTGLLMPVQVLLNHRLGLPRHAAAALTLVASGGALTWLLFYAGNELVYGLNNLKWSLLSGIRELERLVYASPLPVGREQISELSTRATEWLQNNQSTLGQHAANVGGSALSTLGSGLLVMVCTFFFLAQGDVIWCRLLNVAPLRHRERLFQASRRGWVTIGNYAKMQVVVSAVDAIGIGLGAYVIGLPFVIPLTVLVFFLCFIPIFGALLSGVLVVLVALVTGGPTAAVLMLAIVLVVQQLEGNVLCPYLLGKAVNLHPLVIILGVAAGTYVMGLVGALFAVPFLALANTMLLYLRGHDMFPGLDTGGSALTDSARALAPTGGKTVVPPKIGGATPEKVARAMPSC